MRTTEVEIELEPAQPSAAFSEQAPAAAPAPEEATISFVRGDGSKVDATTLLSARQPEDVLVKTASLKLRRFYKTQNELIDALVADIAPQDEREPLVDDAQASRQQLSSSHWQVRAAVQGSFGLNVVLLGAKLIAMIASGSMSVLASLADSLLDLVSGVVLAATQRAMARVDPYKFPEGKARLEPIGVIVFAVVMGMSSLQIIVEATKRLVAVINKSEQVQGTNHKPQLTSVAFPFDFSLYALC